MCAHHWDQDRPPAGAVTPEQDGKDKTRRSEAVAGQLWVYSACCRLLQACGCCRVSGSHMWKHRLELQAAGNKQQQGAPAFLTESRELLSVLDELGQIRENILSS